ncbi:MAG TPA: saccharopine dehydrogenase NADP-binding domain-containing protein [Saprospiraceae bacterium]|nr:saccharopine dehydrogenase NADP-binding domain-containing protein [Saprospiraceae bacterium]HMQ82446.1 saccharopine dehydrogenase NADP-binding domain-containing protein [Saprospiraceae bacterium]
MEKRVLILGGYGGVGRALAKSLLLHTSVDLTIAGHQLSKAEALAKALQSEFSERKIRAVYADAAHFQSLLAAFEGINQVIVTATVPDAMPLIASAALETGTNLMDIFVRGDVVDQLAPFRERVRAKNLVFITQAGFHPGLAAPFIRYAKGHFDQYQSAHVAMAMSALFEKPESTHELIHEIGAGNYELFQNGVWRKATYKDSRSFTFSSQFGTRACFPLQMRELHPLPEELGLTDMGVYAAGFNAFVDYLIFPLIMLLQYIKKGLGTKLSGHLLYWGVNWFYNHQPGVEFRLEASGLKNGLPRKYILSAYADDAYAFTAWAITACVRQCLDGAISTPGLFLMGLVTDEQRLLADLKEMGAQISEKS